MSYKDVLKAIKAISRLMAFFCVSNTQQKLEGGIQRCLIRGNKERYVGGLSSLIADCISLTE